MALYVFPYRFAIRGDTALVLASRNEVLRAREQCIETDNGRIKTGDDATPYKDLLHTGWGFADLANLTHGSVMKYDNTLGYFVPATDSVTDGDKGDITVSGNGSAWAVDAKAITYAKVQDVGANAVLCRSNAAAGTVGEVALAASQLFGRGSAGNLAPITLGSGLLMTLNVLSATGGGGSSDWTMVKKTSNEDRANTTTPTDDAQLKVTLGPSKIYRIRISIFYNSASATPDIKVTNAYTGTLTSVTGIRKVITPGATTVSTASETALLSNGAFTSTTVAPGYLEWEYVVVTNTGGDFSFQFAQNTSGAVPVTVLAGSAIQYADFT